MRKAEGCLIILYVDLGDKGSNRKLTGQRGVGVAGAATAAVRRTDSEHRKAEE
jgi:hypothetical protein